MGYPISIAGKYHAENRIMDEYPEEIDWDSGAVTGMCICLDWYKWEVGLDLSYDIKEEVLEE